MWTANPSSLLNAASYQANQSRRDATRSVVQLHLLLSLHLPPLFCFLPCSGTGSSSSPTARYITAPACGSRGNYSNRSCKTDIKHQPGNLLALICPLHTHGNSWHNKYSVVRVCECTRRGMRQKAWLGLFLCNIICPNREKQSY